jgi:hypothetical protein
MKGANSLGERPRDAFGNLKLFEISRGNTTNSSLQQNNMPISYSRSSVAFNALLLYVGFAWTLLLSVDAIDFLNWNMVEGVGGPFEGLFFPSNNVDYEYIAESGDGLPAVPYTQNEDFRSGLQGLKDIIAIAARERKRLRPYGSRWSYNNLVYTDEYMIDTYGLNYAQIGLQNNTFLTIPYQGEKKEFLAFIQSGVVVKPLYRSLVRDIVRLFESRCTAQPQLTSLFFFLVCRRINPSHKCTNVSLIVLL